MVGMRRLLQDTETGRRLRGQRIRQARIDAGYATQMQLSHALGGASLSSIGAWESGDANPEKYLARLAKVLRLPSTDWLMYDDTESDDAPPADELAGITQEQAARMLRLPPGRLLEDLRARAGELGDDTPKPAPAQRVKPPPPYSGMRELEPPYERAKTRKPRRK